MFHSKILLDLQVKRGKMLLFLFFFLPEEVLQFSVIDRSQIVQHFVVKTVFAAGHLLPVSKLQEDSHW